MIASKKCMDSCDANQAQAGGKLSSNMKFAAVELHRLIKKRSFLAAKDRVSNPLHQHEAGLIDENTKCLPVIVALGISNCPLILIQSIFAAYSYDQVMERIKQLGQDPPLVVAIRKGRPLEIIQYLIEISNIRGLRVDKSKHNELPLHLAANAKLEVTQLLIKADSEFKKGPHNTASHAFLQPDCVGALPLHCFIKDQSKQACIESLLLAYPDASAHADDMGMLPLHYVMKNNASLLTLQCLLAAYPQAARTIDSKGNLPIFCAFQEGSHTANLAPKIDFLLRVYPKAILHKNVNGDTLLSMAQKIKNTGLMSSWCFNSERLINNVLHRSLDEWILLRKEKLGNSKKHALDCNIDGNSITEYGRKRLRPTSKLDFQEGSHIADDDGILDERTLTLTSFSRVILRARDRYSKKGHINMNKCHVCWENQPSFAMVPCGHIALCVDCANIETIIELRGGCPICQNRIFRSQKVVAAEINRLSDSPCVLCLENQRSRIFVPCGHMALCSECASQDTLKKLQMKCPLGRCSVAGIMEIKRET